MTARALRKLKSFDRIVYRRGALTVREMLHSMMHRAPVRQCFKWVEDEPPAGTFRPWDWWYRGYEWGGLTLGYIYKGARH